MTRSTGQVESAAAHQRRWRSEVLPGLRGAVLDLGAGRGEASDYLPPAAQWIPLEPRPGKALRAKAQERPGTRLLTASAESIPLPDASVDAVIASAVLCSVRHQAAALAELIRVLKPGGVLVFFEHVGSPTGTWSNLAEKLYRPVGRLFDRGCDPSRDTLLALHAAGFAPFQLTRSTHPGGFGTTVHIIEGAALR